MTHIELCEQLSIELEQELLSRTEEILKIENLFEISCRSDEDNISGIARKALVLLLYAHFEGYCKQVFQHYILYINRMRIPLSELKLGLVAANLNTEFRKLFDTNHKPVDIKSFSGDGALQQFGRKREFLIGYDTYVSRTADISEAFINTEANLKPDVLRRILFQLELDCTAADIYLGVIHKLVNIRNSFAHGERIGYPSKMEYSEYRGAAFDTMKEIKLLVEAAFREQAFLKTA